MKKGKTSIVLVLDRSGSMASMHKDLVEGVNRFIFEQKALGAGECRVSVVGFDTNIEDTVWDIPIEFVPKFNTSEHFIPRGGTALFDAVGYSIDKLGKDLAGLPESERPEKVIVLIYTDGEENSSRNVNSAQLKEKIELQTNNYAWTFLFLGANQDAILNASQIGISSASALNYRASHIGNYAVFSGASLYTSGIRCEGIGNLTDEIRLCAMAGD